MRLLRFFLYFILLALFFLWLFQAATALDRRLAWQLPSSWSGVGAVLFLGGGALATYCAWLFLTIGQGTPAPFDPPQKFVVRGPYRYVRNPMWLGMLIAHLGVAFFLTSPTLLVLTLIFFILAHPYLVLREEKELEERFGEAYRQYKSTVPRWIPKF